MIFNIHCYGGSTKGNYVSSSNDNNILDCIFLIIMMMKNNDNLCCIFPENSPGIPEEQGSSRVLWGERVCQIVPDLVAFKKWQRQE